MSELRFHMTRMYVVSQLVGINAAAFSYFGFWRQFRWYFALPATVITHYLARNFSMNGSISRLYYPLEPLYEEVRRHQSISRENPRGAVGIRDIQYSQESLSEEQTPILQRDDLSKADKRKILRQTRQARQTAVKSAGMQIAQIES